MLLVSYVRKQTVAVVRRRQLIGPEIARRVRVSFLASLQCGRPLANLRQHKKGNFF
jgi:hypothetical protein